MASMGQYFMVTDACTAMSVPWVGSVQGDRVNESPLDVDCFYVVCQVQVHNRSAPTHHVYVTELGRAGGQ